MESLENIVQIGGLGNIFKAYDKNQAKVFVLHVHVCLVFNLDLCFFLSKHRLFCKMVSGSENLTITSTTTRFRRLQKKAFRLLKL